MIVRRCNMYMSMSVYLSMSMSMYMVTTFKYVEGGPDREAQEVV